MGECWANILEMFLSLMGLIRLNPFNCTNFFGFLFVLPKVLARFTWIFLEMMIYDVSLITCAGQFAFKIQTEYQVFIEFL